MKSYFVKSNFGLERDFKCYEDPDYTKPIYFVDGKIAFGLKADIKDMKGNVLMRLKSPWFNIPRRMRIYDLDNKQIAVIKPHISPIKSRITMDLSDGEIWNLVGNIIGKTYSVFRGEKEIIVIDQKWATIRDKYRVDIDESIDLRLVLGLIYSVDAWREGKS